MSASWLRSRRGRPWPNSNASASDQTGSRSAVAELYLHLPNGMARTKLPGYLDRQLKIPTTVRNWSTVNKLIELSGS